MPSCSPTRILTCTAVLMMVGCGRVHRPGESVSQRPAGPDPVLVEASSDLLPEVEKARVGGRYRMLLTMLKAEQDRAAYSDFCEFGFSAVPKWYEHTELPAGYWVYVYPYWFIWRDDTRRSYATCDWGPEQATGQPNTPAGNDQPTAWCPSAPDRQYEWLLLEYPASVQPAAVVIHQSLNPGAVNKVSTFKPDGGEVTVWTGLDENKQPLFRIPLKIAFRTNRVRIWLDARGVPGWNEIDAVALQDASGQTHWASAAHASSTYAEPEPGVMIPHRSTPAGDAASGVGR
jgi:hypothetical protein